MLVSQRLIVSMHCFLFVHFLGSRMASFFGFVLDVVNASADAFAHGVARIFGFLLVAFG